MLLLLVEQVMPTLWIVLIMVFLILTLLLALRFGGVYGYGLYRKWTEKIPNPSKSLLFQDGGKGLWSAGGMAASASKNPTPPKPQSSLFTEQQGVSYMHLEDTHHQDQEEKIMDHGLRISSLAMET
ncbi:interleukin-3 receptor class 2 subunit beta-like [Mastomys coucha]|uniref:interleukin-3 receptor class 2 subunit beta-like n=1 Tax=Mastomys coucha TaxID=35658 RepID=UPI001261DBF7|nr:interleukin-3 receptor class 2 subunit beta-like [Mastomys coucha]